MLYQIALTLIPGIGPIKAKSLLAHCGSAENVFRETKRALTRIPEIGSVMADVIRSSDVIGRAEKELEFIERHSIIPLFIGDSNYPERLKQCDDSPVVLYTKGNMNLGVSRVVSIVGSRSSTPYGKEFCDHLLDTIKAYDPLIVSGLAYGIDIAAHKKSVELGLATVGCLAHGLEKIYPPVHLPVANEMLNRGGLVTEFVSHTKQAAELFPMRNRIIAGLADCTVVVETDLKGGSIITAYLANSYGREVFALPGRHNDRMSSGCNELIKRNIAAILSHPSDLISYMNWESTKSKPPVQLPLFQEFTADESKLLNYLNNHGKTTLDILSTQLNQSISELSTLLLELEFKGVVKSLPGKVYVSV